MKKSVKIIIIVLVMSIITILGFVIIKNVGKKKTTTKPIDTTVKPTTSKNTSSEKKNRYSINVSMNIAEAGSIGGSGFYDDNSEVTLNVSVNSGYKFLGWYIGEELKSASLSYNFIITSNIDFIAKFEALPVEKCTVIFDSDGGKLVDSQTVNKGSKAVEPEEPKKEGYTFDGWYYNDTKWVFVGYSITEDITLKAKWIINGYLLTLTKNLEEAGSLSGAGVYDYDKEVTITATTLVDGGYEFLGWFDGEERIAEESTYTFNMPANNVSYEARWETISYDLTVLSNNSEYGSVTGSGTYEYNSLVTLTATPSEGYLFEGWCHDTDEEIFSTTNPITINMPVGNTTYTARFISEKRNYIVEHQLEQLNGLYETDYTDNLVGIIGNSTNAVARDYAGFTPKTFSQVTITMYGEIKVIIKYDRNLYTLTLNVNEPVTGWAFGSGVYQYGREIFIGAEPYDGYKLVGWYNGDDFLSDSIEYKVIIPNEDITITAVFDIRTDIEYHVNHLLENFDGTYSIDARETLVAAFLEETQAVAKTYTGFTSKDFEQKTIDNLYSIDVNIYYERNTYNLSVETNNNPDITAGLMYGIINNLRHNNTTTKTLDITNELYMEPGYFIYNSYYDRTELYDYWKDFYSTYRYDCDEDDADFDYDYSYLVNEYKLYNPSFYSRTLGSVDVVYPADMNSPLGKLYSHIENGLYRQYYDKNSDLYIVNHTDVTYILFELYPNFADLNIQYDYLNDKVTIRFSVVENRFDPTSNVAKDHFGNIYRVKSKGLITNKMFSTSMTAEQFLNTFIYNSNYSIDSIGKVEYDKNYYKYDEDAVVKAIPNSGYRFVGWYENDVLISSSLTYSFKMKDNRKLKAVFEKIYEQEEDKIYFGYYPQTLETNESIKNTLNGLAENLPTESAPYDWNCYGYYGSTDDTDYMWYIDIDLDNDGRYDYRGVYFTKYRPIKAINDNTEDFSYQDNNGYNIEEIYWFKFEKIEWNILTQEDGKAMIVANLILDSHEAYPSDTESSFEHNGGVGYANNYELSDIRKWLNDNFYNTAFDDAEKGIIRETLVNNNSSSTYGSNDTNDFVYLLSLSEYQAYYTTTESKKIVATDYAKSQGIHVVGDYGYWRIRTAAINDPNYLYCVGPDAITYIGYTDGSDNGVLPSIWINL